MTLDNSNPKRDKAKKHLFYLLFYLIYLYVCVFFIYFYFYFLFSWFSLKHMIGYPQSQLQWEIVHIAAYLTQRKLNTQQIIAYPSEKQDNIQKNKPKKKMKHKFVQSN